MGFTAGTNNRGAAKAARREETRPTHDQLYLMGRINGSDDLAPKGRLTVAAIQRLNNRHGVAATTSAMRTLRQFAPDDLRRAYPYLQEMLRRNR